MNKTMIIVGAGISGLSTGCYAQMNGFKTEIFEMHTIAGGLCTAWRRKGYNFDISMHLLTGSASGPFHRMWGELGITEKFKFHYHDHLSRIEGMGKKLTLSVDRKNLEEDMIAISPDDSKLIKEFTSLLFGPDMMKAVSLKPAETKNLYDKIRVIPLVFPLLRTFIKYNGVTLQQFASRFKDPFLREAVRFTADAPGWPMPHFPMAVLAGFIKNGVTEAGAPQGGSQQVVYHIADLYKKLGGEIHFNNRVTDLILDKDRVLGIRLEDGTEHRADNVVWAGDGHTLIFDILKEKYVNEKIRKIYDEWIPVKPILHVMIGVNRDLSKEPHNLVIELDKPVTVAGREHKWLTLIHHCFDRSMAPAGKSAVEAWFSTEYEYWNELVRDREKYDAEKQRISGETISHLEKRWPGFASQVEVIDIPTPATYRRFTGNWQGSPDGWYLTTDNFTDMEPVRNLPGLEGLHMVGQWTSPYTGTVIAALSGRQLVELMCKKEGREFVCQGV
jgi:phytoene dehydrogenase-like protein